MSLDPDRPASVEEAWRRFLTTGEAGGERDLRSIFKHLPRDPRCRSCFAPFQGPGSTLVRLLFGKRPSKLNPHLCNVCEEFAAKHHGGAEVELTMLFVDVRGSTTLAEKTSPLEFSRLIDRFYQASTEVLIQTDALIDKLIGDEVAGIYIPGYAGPAHASRAVEAAQGILRATGHARPGGPWISVGAGVHTGISFMGAVGSEEGVTDITALGDVPNVAARLASRAAGGEVLVSEAAALAAHLDTGGFELRALNLRGRAESINTFVIHVGSPDKSSS